MAKVNSAISTAVSTARSLPAIPYPVRESARAKRVSIKVFPEGRVEIVVPVGFDRQQLAALVQSREAWIRKTLSSLVQTQQALPGALTEPRPEQISLRAIGEDWAVSYDRTAYRQALCREIAPQHLCLSQSDESIALEQGLLRQWLDRKAKYHLPNWLRQVSHEVALPCRRISIRWQKTLWASCSHKHNISLNAKLLFLPPPIVRYVFIHELCHTVHLNHSARFWALVHTKDPDYKQHDRALKNAWQLIPSWVDATSNHPEMASQMATTPEFP